MIYSILGFVYFACILATIAILSLAMVRSLTVKKAQPSSKNLIYLVPAFLFAYLLYLTAAFYQETEVNVFYCFNLIGTTLNFFVFSADISLISPIAGEYFIYAVDFVLTAIISSAAMVFNVYTFFSLRVRNFFSLRRGLKGDCDVVIGTSPDALHYAAVNKKNCVVWACNFSRPYADLLKSGLTVFRAPLSEKGVCLKLNRGAHNLIAFRDGSYGYAQIIDVYGKLNKSGCDLRLNIEANQEEMKILKEEFVAKANRDVGTHISCFSKYELTARRFVVNHPLTKYIPRDFYNENCTLKSDKEINVVFVGFGKANYQLFRMCATQFQFAGEEQGKLVSKPVNYYVYDKEDSALHNEFFSRILCEFDRDFADCDFEKPDKICNLTVRKKNVESVEAKKEFAEIVSENSFTYFILSLRDDLEDASYAQTLKRFLPHGNYRIFVRAKKKDDESLSDEGPIIYFGEEKEYFRHENVVNDDLTAFAQRLNLLYSNVRNSPAWLKEVKAMPVAEQSEGLQKGLENPQNAKYMKDKWCELPFIEQSSNLYHALNMSFKLYLLGFRMQRKQDGEQGISEEEFNERYQNAGRENNYADYSYFFQTQSANVLAFTEHLRWNALYILFDYKQMKKKDMQVQEKTDGAGNIVRSVAHKNLAKKEHGCLTTYYGLHDLVLFKYGLLYPEADLSALDYKTDKTLHDLGKIYAYDYMDLDKLYSEIAVMGYVLTK